MCAQMLYDANYDRALLEERDKAKDLCHQYNQLRPSDRASQQEVLKKLLGKTGENFTLTAPFWCDYGYNIELGENFYANHNLVILDGAKVTFGDNVFIGPDCGFHTAGHPIDFERRNRGWNMRIPLRWATMSGLARGFRLCPGSPSEAMWSSAAEALWSRTFPTTALRWAIPVK